MQPTGVELSIEELTAEAMQLLTIGLEELYVVLGCQLMGATRPARVAGLVSHQSALKSIVQSGGGNPLSLPAADLVECGRSFESMHEELKRHGICFVAAIKEELRDGLRGDGDLDLLNEVSTSDMQAIVLIVTGILRLPRRIEAASATVAAIICKLGSGELCA